MPKVRTRTPSGADRGAQGKHAGAEVARQSVRTRAIICTALVVLTLAAFHGVFRNGFVNFDDNKYITGNSHVVTGLTAENLKWAFNVGCCGNWHPLTWMSHMLDSTLFGLNPAGHHAVGLVLHIANAVLLFLLLSRLTRSHWRSAFVAALFAIHPLHVESVAWASERKDVLSTLFWMLTMWAYVWYTERPVMRRYALVVAAFVLGLMAKPMLVTLPVVLLLLDYWPLQRVKKKEERRKTVSEKLPLFAISLGSCVITYLAQRRTDAVSSLDTVPVAIRIENALTAYAGYLVKTVWPVCLAVFYPYPVEHLPVWQVAGSVIVLAAITVLVIRAKERHPYLLFGWLWYVVTLLPVIGLVQVGSQSTADRYTYVPLIGVFVAIAWGASQILGKGEREKGREGEERSTFNVQRSTSNTHVIAGIALAILVTLSAATHRQVGFWRDNMTLFGHAVECTEGNYKMHNSLGLALADEGRMDEAIEEYRRALDISPQYVSALLDMGIALSETGRTDDAMGYFEEAIRQKPDFADCYYNYGKALEIKGEIRGAIEQYTKAVELDPSHVEAQISIGVVLLQSGQSDAAVEHLTEALGADPLSLEARTNLGLALYKSGDKQGGIRELQEVTRMQPDYGDAHVNLAIIYYYEGRYAEAAEAARSAQSCGYELDQAFVQALSEKLSSSGM